MASLERSMTDRLAGSVTVLLGALVCLVALGVSGCDEKTADNVARVKMGGKTFFLEIVDDNQKRFKGLSGREHIDADGGMIFVFPPAQVVVQKFVMRDCPIPIDIVYLDGAGRVLATHEMKPLPPRAADGSEGKAGPTSGDKTPENSKYEARLEQYSSRYPSQIVIELAGGTLKTLNLKEGDKIDLDVEGLKKRAR